MYACQEVDQSVVFGVLLQEDLGEGVFVHAIQADQVDKLRGYIVLVEVIGHILSQILKRKSANQACLSFFLCLLFETDKCDFSLPCASSIVWCWTLCDHRSAKLMAKFWLLVELKRGERADEGWHYRFVFLYIEQLWLEI